MLNRSPLSINSTQPSHQPLQRKPSDKDKITGFLDNFGMTLNFHRSVAFRIWCCFLTGTSAHGEGSALTESDAEDLKSSEDFEEARDADDVEDDDVTSDSSTFIGSLQEAWVTQNVLLFIQRLIFFTLIVTRIDATYLRCFFVFSFSAIVLNEDDGIPTESFLNASSSALQLFGWSE